VYLAPEGTLYKTIVIPNADASHRYKLIAKGTGSGIMELKVQVPDAKNKCKRYLEYTNVPVSATTTARVNIEPKIALPEIATIRAHNMRDRTTKLGLDSDGDGVFEIESTPGKFERQKAMSSVVKANVDICPDTIDLTSTAKEKSITAYIELPEGYEPDRIDISTVRLMKDIPALETPVDIVDHDQNGIYELMVKFDRQLVIDCLAGEGQIEGRVSLSLTGIIDGRLFKGAHTILVISSGIKQEQSHD
jgi:hypothetical protein